MNRRQHQSRRNEGHPAGAAVLLAVQDWLTRHPRFVLYAAVCVCIWSIAIGTKW